MNEKIEKIIDMFRRFPTSFSKVQLAEIRDEIEDFLTFPPTEIKEIPLFEGTLQALDKLSILTPPHINK